MIYYKTSSKEDTHPVTSYITIADGPPVKTLVAIDHVHEPTRKERFVAWFRGWKYYNHPVQGWQLKRKVTGFVDNDGWFIPWSLQAVTYKIWWPYGLYENRFQLLNMAKQAGFTMYDGVDLVTFAETATGV